MRSTATKNVAFNFGVSTLEAGFFGLGMGFASYVTVIPLFIASLTDSGVLIGLISAMRLIGWQLPQLLTANRVASLRRYKPMVLMMTLIERLPFLPLALVALASPTLGREATLLLAFAFVILQSLGGGFTATAWISMTAKIIPPPLHGRFYGMLGASLNLLSSGGAVLSGVILAAGTAPEYFALCFLLAAFATMISFGFLTQVREPEADAATLEKRTRPEFWRGLRRILREDGNFRTFILARSVAQFASIGPAFFTIYAVRHFGMDPGTAGILTGLLLLAQVVGSPVIGWLGDRYSHRLMYACGALLACASTSLAFAAPSLEWFYLVFALAGLANAGLMTPIYALAAEFGSPAERPYYIGLSSTLTAPAALIAPILGGWLADTTGYGTTFTLAAVTGLLTAAVMVLLVREPNAKPAKLAPA